jgi:flagellar biosynthetic protein FlhB
MAENDSSQEKTEEPTPRRLQKAREDGEAPRSKELTTTAILVGASIGFLWFGGFLSNKILDVLRFNFTLERETIFDTSMMAQYLVQSMADVLLGLFPLFSILLIAAVIGPIALGGWLFSVKALQPKFNRMNPLEGIKRMFSIKSLVELGKAIAKVSLMIVLAVLMLNALKGDLKSLAFEDIAGAIAHSTSISAWVAIGLSAATILIALVDVPFQIWEHTKKLRMSVQDIKDEMKDSDGKPEVKSKIRQLQQAMANRRMMAEVPEADVVITNPTHYAVAIKYKPDDMTTPIVVAKGIDQIALKIREIAGVHEIEIVESPRLARAVYYTTDLDAEIPTGLYVAVAKILAYVFQLRNFRRGDGQRPAFPHSVSVPDDMIYDE